MTVSSTTTGGSVDTCAGGMVGYAPNTTTSGNGSIYSPTLTVQSDGSLSCVASTSSNVYTGGIVGKTDGATVSPTISSAGTLTLQSTAASGSTFSGGIIGYATSTLTSGNGSLVSPTLITEKGGSIVCTAKSTTSIYAGGMAAKIDGSVTSPQVKSAGDLSVSANTSY